MGISLHPAERSGVQTYITKGITVLFSYVCSGACCRVKAASVMAAFVDEWGNVEYNSCERK